ncbi:MAG: GAF domain-containing protein [Candidatus Sumerlaeia bacterium]|nr:GAF domain-containing protein [Candidatus Sumerlaeia bacterium]
MPLPPEAGKPASEDPQEPWFAHVLRLATDAENGVGSRKILEELLLAARTWFSVKSCGLWKVSSDGRVRNLFFAIEGRIWSVEEIDGRFPEFGGIGRLFREGFLVPKDYLHGNLPGDHRPPAVLDHSVESTYPLFHAFGRLVGPVELNLPVLVDGAERFSLTLHRAAGSTYTPAEIQSARSFARAAGLIGSLLEREETALALVQAQEQRQAMALRNQRLADANRILNRVAEDSEVAGSPDGILGRLLVEVCGVVRAERGAIFLPENGKQRLRAGFFMESGGLIDVARSEAHALWREGFDFDALAGTESLAGGRLVVGTLDEVAPQLWAPSVEWHRRMGTEALVMAPLHYGGRLVGLLGLGVSAKVIESQEDLELVLTIAHAISLSAALRELAETEKNLAVSIEREEAARNRAEELNRANEALKGTLDRLASDKEIASFLSHLALTAQISAGAISNAIFLMDESGESYHLSAYALRGEVLDLHTDPRIAIWRQPVPKEENADADAAMRSGKPVVHDVPVIASDQMAWPRAIEFHRSMGHGSVVAHPMIAGDRYLGFMGLCFSDRASIVPRKLELAEALAQQGSLAVLLSRQGEEIARASVAQEVERAGRAWAEELLRASAAMGASVGSLSSSQGLDDFLTILVQEAIRTSGAVSGTIFVHDPEKAEITQVVHILRGVIVTDLRSPENAPFHEPIPTDGFDGWRVTAEDDSIFWLDYSYKDSRDLEFSHDFHQRLGHRFVAAIPMRNKREVLGFLGLAWDKSLDVRPTEERLELCRLLAHQAAIAQRLTVISKVAQEAAVTRERERLAQERAAELELINAELVRRDRLLDALTEATKLLLQSPDLNKTILEALALMAEAGGFHRGGLLENCDEAGRPCNAGWFRVLHEWAQGELPKQGDGDYAMGRWADLTDEGMPDGAAMLAAGQVVDGGREDCSELCRAMMESIGAHYTVCAPIHVGEYFWGALAFDDCVTSRRRSEEEKNAFRAAAQVFGLAIHRARTQREREDLQRQMQEERERAARARVEELARTNEALLGTLEMLGDAEEPGVALNHVIQSVAARLDAESGTLWVVVEGGTMVRRIRHCEGGKVLNAEQMLHGTGAEAVKMELLGSIWAESRVSERVAVLGPAAFSELALRDPSDELRGATSLVILKLIAGRRAIGLMTLRYSRSPALGPSELELAEALAHQVALAMELTRLSGIATEAAALAERHHLSRELHDTMAQGFAGIVAQLGAIEVEGRALPPEVVRRLDRTQSLARASLAEARRVLSAMRPGLLRESRGLVAALETLCSTAVMYSQAEVSFRVSGPPDALAPDAEDELLRIAQESLHNADKYANAGRIIVELEVNPDAVSLRIADDGRGFDTESSTGGFGITSMRERARKLGGQLIVRSSPGAGTTISTQIPLR